MSCQFVSSRFSIVIVFAPKLFQFAFLVTIHNINSTNVLTVSIVSIHGQQIPFSTQRTQIRQLHSLLYRQSSKFLTWIIRHTVIIVYLLHLGNARIKVGIARLAIIVIIIVVVGVIVIVIRVLIVIVGIVSTTTVIILLQCVILIIVRLIIVHIVVLILIVVIVVVIQVGIVIHFHVHLAPQPVVSRLMHHLGMEYNDEFLGIVLAPLFGIVQQFPERHGREGDVDETAPMEADGAVGVHFRS